MANIDYDFNLGSRNRKRRGGQWSRGMRLTVLFCAVAAITAAVIYALVPGKSVKPIKKVAPAEEKAVPAPSAETQAETPALSETAPAAAPETAPQEENNTVQQESSAATEPPPRSDGDLPEKGQVLPSDPKPADDMPQRNGENMPEMANYLDNLLQEKNYTMFFAEADRIISATAPDSTARAELGGILTRGRKNLWQNGQWQHFAVTHKVVSGDNLSTLARRNHTTVSLLKKANRLKSANIMIGQQLKIVRGPWKVLICKKARLMTLLQKVDGKEMIFAVFSIGTGRKNSTPSGNFVICHRSYHPVYRDNHGRVFKYGHKENPLGECFLALARPESPAKPFRGYGIHGTADETSVGRSLSNGCIRMHNDDVSMLYHLLPAGTIVEIKD